ncbi:MAG: hypothetical protein IPN94_12120 [Sphingobacteriales bacterium]|nr:hypothetical protein [Sphingobacteriales bacterium]
MAISLLHSFHSFTLFTLSLFSLFHFFTPSPFRHFTPSPRMSLCWVFRLLLVA